MKEADRVDAWFDHRRRDDVSSVGKGRRAAARAWRFAFLKGVGHCSFLDLFQWVQALGENVARLGLGRIVAACVLSSCKTFADFDIGRCAGPSER